MYAKLVDRCTHSTKNTSKLVVNCGIIRGLSKSVLPYQKVKAAIVRQERASDIS